MKTRLFSYATALAALSFFPAVKATANDDAVKAAASSPLAPSWKLRDVNGKELTSADFKVKVVVLDFWATWCRPCRAEIPGYVDLYKKYGKAGLVIVGVSLDSKGPTVVKKFMDEYKMNYPVVMGDQSIAEQFGGVEAIPTTFLIDREGRIRHQKVGALETSDYEKLIKSVL